MKQLFKYSPSPRNLFEDGFIRLSQLAVLNDPFEASFCSSSLDDLASNFDYQHAQDSEFGEIGFSDYVALRVHNVGIISLSENKENLLMWAHYANEHKGVVAGIVYDPILGSIFEKIFRADALINNSLTEEFSPFNGVPKPVSYRKGLRYRNDRFDYDYSNIEAEGSDRILYEILMQKSDEWIYEQEYRVVLRLEQADRVIIENMRNIENKKIQENIMELGCFSINKIDNSCTIDLHKIEDDAMRVVIAIELAKLSRNSNTIYLMKLNASCINNCLIGLKSMFQKIDVQGKFAMSVGYLDVWKAVKNSDYYSLEFMKL